MSGNDRSSPWQQAAPQGAEPARRVTSDAPPAESVSPAWGRAPVPVPRGGRLQPMAAVAAPDVPHPVGQVVFGPGELLRLRERERAVRVRSIEASGWPGRRGVLVGSLYGGTGVSTLAAQLAWAARSRGLPAVLLDGSSAYGSGAASRLSSDVRMSHEPGWADLAFLDQQGPTGLADAFAARLPSLSAEVPVLVGGRSVPDRRRPPAGLLAVAVSAALAGGWPFVAVDAGAGADPLTAALSVWAADLAVLVCRADALEVRESADYLRHLSSVVGRPAGRSILAIVHGGRVTRPVAQARAAVSDTAAGSVAVQMVDQLRDRSAVVAAAPPPVSLLMAALAISPSLYSSGRGTR